MIALRKGRLHEAHRQGCCWPAALSSKTPKKKHPPRNIISPVPTTQNLVATTVAGIDITPNWATWALYHPQRHEVVKFSSYPLLDMRKKVCPSELLDLALKVKSAIDPSDIYVLEDRNLTKSSKSFQPSPMGTNLLVFQSMLSVYLSEGYDPENPVHKVFYLQPAVILRLFKLVIGGERISSQHILRQSIINSGLHHIVDNKLGIVTDNDQLSDANQAEIASRLQWTDEHMANRVWGRDDGWRENISNAILTAVSFAEMGLLRGDLPTAGEACDEGRDPG